MCKSLVHPNELSIAGGGIVGTWTRKLAPTAGGLLLCPRCIVQEWFSLYRFLSSYLGSVLMLGCYAKLTMTHVLPLRRLRLHVARVRE